jgi:hypothetical protein
VCPSLPLGRRRYEDSYQVKTRTLSFFDARAALALRAKGAAPGVCRRPPGRRRYEKTTHSQEWLCHEKPQGPRRKTRGALGYNRVRHPQNLVASGWATRPNQKQIPRANSALGMTGSNSVREIDGIHSKQIDGVDSK